MKYSRNFFSIREKRPLVFCITNFVTVNDCANCILACGGSPVMSCDPREASDMARIADSVLINTGTPSEETVEAMKLAGKEANSLGLPVILDPAGVSATPLRQRINLELLEEIRFSVIRGNASEIGFLAGSAGTSSCRGVDAAGSNELDAIIANTITLAKSQSCVVATSGETDVVSDGKNTLLCRNGRSIMTLITGSGCMSGALTAACCGASKDALYESTVASVLAMGMAGEIAEDRLRSAVDGTGSFRTYLIDALYNLDERRFKENASFEEI